MANWRYTKDIVDDVLWRAGEPTDGSSEFHSRALELVNRAYQAVWMGGSEIDPSVDEEWWWLRAQGTIILQPALSVSVAVTKNSTSISFSSAPSQSVQGWFLRVAGRPTVYQIVSHTGGATAATLDQAYLEDSGTVTATVLQLQADLGSIVGGDINLLKVVSPMYAHVGSGEPHEVEGIDLAALMSLYPLATLASGTPDRFAHVDEQTVQFNRYRAPGSAPLRIDFWYLRHPADLTYSATEEPLVPHVYRRILADAAAYWIFMDKNDDRADASILAARALLKAMQREHRHRMTQQGRLGQISPRRPPGGGGRLLRTESGHIIG